MITAKEVREKAKKLNKIQEEEQLLKEEEQLIEIERDIMAAIKEDAKTTSILGKGLSSNNKSKLEGLGYFCDNIGKISYYGFCYEISWKEI